MDQCVVRLMIFVHSLPTAMAKALRALRLCFHLMDRDVKFQMALGLLVLLACVHLGKL